MIFDTNDLSRLCLNIGFKIRNKINSMDYKDRASITSSIFKGSGTKLPDAEGEKIIVEALEKFSSEHSIRIGLIIDAVAEKVYWIGNSKSKEAVWAFADPVDGTIKVAGLGNEGNIYRMGNDGIWAFGIAFTRLTTKPLEELRVKDFMFSVIVDGNPMMWPYSPTNAWTLLDGNQIKTFELSEKNTSLHEHNQEIRLYSSTQTNLQQATVCYDAFNGYDRKTATKGTEELLVEIFKSIANRNEKGAFNVVIIYSNLSCILRELLGYGSDLFEPQGVAFIVPNENFPNLITIYSIIIGAGGYVVDFEGNDIGNGLITTKRPNIIYAANKTIKEKLLEEFKNLTVVVPH